jgi:hypothetical protein
MATILQNFIVLATELLLRGFNVPELIADS